MRYNISIKYMEMFKIEKTANINIPIEPELKKEVKSTLNDLGMNLVEAITIYLKQIVMTDSIHLWKSLNLMKKRGLDMNLLIYTVDKKELILTAVRTSSHSDLLDK